MPARGRVIVITGAMATGKSTVADLLAIRLPKSVHIHGDMFRRMVVSGRADMTPNPSADAIAQLNLRYDLAAMAADRCAEDGFDAIVQDVILGRDLADFVKRIASPERYLVVLSPRVSALEWREEQRPRAVIHLWPEPSVRGCVARRPRSATGSTAVLKPPRRRSRTSSPICTGQRSRAPLDGHNEGRAHPGPAPRHWISAIVAEIKLLQRHGRARPLTEVVVERVVPDH